MMEPFFSGKYNVVYQGEEVLCRGPDGGHCRVPLNARTTKKALQAAFGEVQATDHEDR